LTISRIAADENVRNLVVTTLRSRGIDVVELRADARSGLPDAVQLQWCLEQDLPILTHDSDFVSLATRAAHPGILYCHQRKHQPMTLVDAVLDGLERLQSAGTPVVIFL
jgi:predicted nuclease of predicted toxin-antitoxin system